jgi:zinc protease
MHRICTAALAIASALISPFTLVAQAPPQAPAPTTRTTPPRSGQASAPAPALRAASAALPLDPAVRYGKLPNGLTYYVRRNPKPEVRAELRLVVNAGSVLEDDPQRGLAHFVEHMAFNGTREYEKQELVSFIERIGMQFGVHLNASTSFDETIYQLRVPTDRDTTLARGIDVLAQWAAAVTFDSTQVERQRGVVLEEWRQGLGAGQRMLNKQLPVMLANSRYAIRIPIGDTVVIRTAPAAQLVRFYRDWYRPDLMAVVAVGDFNPDTVVAMVRRELGAIPAHPGAGRERPRPRYTVPSAGPRGTVATDPEARSSQVTIMHLGPSLPLRTEADWRRNAAEALADAMMSARLAELAQGADAPFLSANASRARFVRPVEMTLLSATLEDGGMARGMTALATEAERVRRYGFTQAELARARSDLLVAYETAYAERDKTPSRELVEGYVGHFLRGEAAPGIGAEYALAKRVLPAITLAEVNRASAAWLEPTGRVLVGNAPTKADVRAATAAELQAAFAAGSQAKVTPYREALANVPLVQTPPTPGRIVAVQHDSVLGTTEWTLSNGARVVFKPTDFRADEILLSAFAPGGSSLAPDSLLLTADYAPFAIAEMGFGAFSGTDLAKVTAGKSVGLFPVITSEFTRLVGSATPRDSETLLQLTWLAMTDPRRDSTVFKRFLARARSEAQNRSLAPQSAFSDTLQAILSQHSPRAQPVTPARVDSIRLDGLLQFWRARMADAGNFTFVFVGNIDTTTFRPLVERWIGGLPSNGHTEGWRDLGIRPPTGVVTATVRKGREPQARTALVFTGPSDAGRRERFDLDMLEAVLEMRLRDRLREALSGTYGVSVDAAAAKVPWPRYSVRISFGSAPDRTDELSRAAFDEIAKLQADGATADEVAKVRETRRRQLETGLKTNSFWTRVLGQAYETGISARELVSEDDLLAQLSPELVRDAARRYLRTDTYVRVTLLPE